MFQQCYYTRIREIERATASPPSPERPLQILHSWFETRQTYHLAKFLKVMFLPQVALPHVIVVLGGLGIGAWLVMVSGQG